MVLALRYRSCRYPESFSLSSAYPNPFNPSTNMTLALDADSQVSMMVYNLVGQVVDVLVDGNDCWISAK